MIHEQFNSNRSGADMSSNNYMIVNQNSNGVSSPYHNGNNNERNMEYRVNNPNRRSMSGYSTKSNPVRGQTKMAQFMTAIQSVPAIPGKNQRVLINKQRGV